MLSMTGLYTELCYAECQSEGHNGIGTVKRVMFYLFLGLLANKL
jgi:hypothetical protein